MPAKKKPAALPDYLEEFLAGLEAQILAGERLNRDEALRPIEQKLGRIIDLDEEFREHPDAQERFDRIWRRVKMRVTDSAIDKASEGKASGTGVLRALGDGGGGSGGRGGNGRLQLPREHRGKADRAW